MIRCVTSTEIREIEERRMVGCVTSTNNIIALIYYHKPLRDAEHIYIFKIGSNSNYLADRSLDRK
jgi:hypothetical protein